MIKYKIDIESLFVRFMIFSVFIITAIILNNFRLLLPYSPRPPLCPLSCVCILYSQKKKKIIPSKSILQTGSIFCFPVFLVNSKKNVVFHFVAEIFFFFFSFVIFIEMLWRWQMKCERCWGIYIMETKEKI